MIIIVIIMIMIILIHGLYYVRLYITVSPSPVEPTKTPPLPMEILVSLEETPASV